MRCRRGPRHGNNLASQLPRHLAIIGGFEVSKKYRRTFWRKGGVPLFRGCSSGGRAVRLQRTGQRFESAHLHSPAQRGFFFWIWSYFPAFLNTRRKFRLNISVTAFLEYPCFTNSSPSFFRPDGFLITGSLIPSKSLPIAAQRTPCFSRI